MISSPAITKPPPILMLAGPTGSGKTALAVELAQRFPLEIISADSMQVYRGMEIGTAQPTDEERARAKFHVCGVIDPAEPFNVQRFVELCYDARNDIAARGRTPIYVGGSGLYLRALRWGLLPGAEREDAVRERLEDEIESRGAPAMHERLKTVDPGAARKINPNDAIRIVRALEVFETTGQKISEKQSQWGSLQPRFPHELIVIDMPRDTLDARIRRRTQSMIDAGWIEETRSLLARGLPRDQHCFKALGYREIFEHLDGNITRAELIDLIALRTRQFAKRQRTWLRREQSARWIETPGSAADAFPIIANLLDNPASRSL